MVKLPKIQNKNGFCRIVSPFSLYNTLGSSSYMKLPRQLLKISILRLDGSSFSVYVSRKATVASLEFAIEEVYGVLPDNEGNVLWSLIWSHFCLCYKGQKLIKEKAFLKSYGIKDGDQLSFTRHIRIDHKYSQQQSANEYVESKQHILSNDHIARANDYASIKDQESDERCFNWEQGLAFPQEKFKLSHFFKDMLSCSRMHGFGRRGSTYQYI